MPALCKHRPRCLWSTCSQYTYVLPLCGAAVMEESEEAQVPVKLTAKEALARRQAQHQAWKQQFFHSRPPPTCLGRLHRRQKTPIGRSVGPAFKRARDIAAETARSASPTHGNSDQVDAPDTGVGALVSSADDAEALEMLPPRLRRRHEWCARLSHELSLRDPSTDVQIRSDPRCTTVLSHLHSDSTEADVHLFAEQIGHVESVRLICDRRTGASRRYAFVEYRYPADAAKAIQLSGKKRLHGRVVNIDMERGRTQPGFLPRRFAQAAKYDPRVGVTHVETHSPETANTAKVTAQDIKTMSEDEFLNAMLNL